MHAAIGRTPLECFICCLRLIFIACEGTHMARGEYLRIAVSWLSIPTRVNPWPSFQRGRETCQPRLPVLILSAMHLLLALSIFATGLLQGCGEEVYRLPNDGLNVAGHDLDAGRPTKGLEVATSHVHASDPSSPRRGGEELKRNRLATLSKTSSSCVQSIRLSGVVQSRDHRFDIALVSVDGGLALPLQRGGSVGVGRMISSISRDSVLLKCPDGAEFKIGIDEHMTDRDKSLLQQVEVTVTTPVHTQPPPSASSSLTVARSSAIPEMIEMAHREFDLPPSD